MSRLPEVIELGNADIERPEPWEPWTGPKERAQLPGEEHKHDPDTKVWPWLTENMTFALVAVMGAAGIALRMGWL